MLLPPGPKDRRLSEVPENVAGNHPPENLPGIPASEKEKSQNTDGYHGPGEADQAQLISAPGRPVQRNRIQRAREGENEKKGLHRGRQSDGENINYDQRQGCACHPEPAILNLADDFSSQLGPLGHQSRPYVPQPKVDDGL